MNDKRTMYWTMFAKDAQKSGSALYARISEGVVRDDELKAMAAGSRKGQPHAPMLLGAVKFLLIRGAQHELRRFYPGFDGGAIADGDDPFPAFRDFCFAHRAEIEALIARRVTNTNEVGRSAVLHAGFRAAAKRMGEPFNAIEIGPSAGLNMIWDRYGVRYVRDGETVARISPESSLVIDCELRGAKAVPAGPTPRVDRRIGLELNPVDLSDADDRDWLRALVWPDQVGRAERLERAMALFESARPEIRGGDALALLPDALAVMPQRQPLCVYHTIAVYQFSGEMRETLDAILTVAGLRRPIWRLSLEGVPQDGTWPIWLTLSRYHDGTVETATLAEAHPHGAWLEWLE